MTPKAHVIRYSNVENTIGMQVDDWSQVVYRLSLSEAKELVRQLQQAIKDAKT
mgnify:FL=1